MELKTAQVSSMGLPEDYFCATTTEHTEESLNNHIEKRYRLAMALQGRNDLKAICRELCAKDPAFFINNFVYTNFPRNQNGMSDCPFVLYDYQEWAVQEWVQNIEVGHDWFIEKSREMGVSWLMAAIFLWFFLFKNQFVGLMASHKLEFVDTGGPDPNTHMGRIHYMLDRLPDFMRPRFERKQQKISNLLNGSIISGSSTEEIGRGGRYHCVFFDELAFWESGQYSFDNAKAAAHSRCVNSTANGEDNDFFRIRQSLALNTVDCPWLDALAQKKGLADAGITHRDDRSNLSELGLSPEDIAYMMKRYRLHWVLHPSKDADWYKKERLRMSRDALAREHDISYNMASSAQVFKDFNPLVHEVRGEYKVDPRLDVFRVWDFGCTSALLYVQVDRMNRVHVFHEVVLEERVEGTSGIDLQIQRAHYETQKVCPKNHIIDICDPAGNQDHHRTVSTDIAYLQQVGIYPRYEQIRAYKTNDRKKHTRDAIKLDLQKFLKHEPLLRVYVGQNSGCPILSQAFNGSYAYKVSRQGQIDFDKVSEKHPYEDVMDCLFYFYVESGRLSSVALPAGFKKLEDFTPAKLQLNRTGRYF